MRLQQLQERNAIMANKTLSKLSNNFTWGFEFEIAYTDEINNDYFDFETYEDARNYWYENLKPTPNYKDANYLFRNRMATSPKKLQKILTSFPLKDNWKYNKDYLSIIYRINPDTEFNQIEDIDFYDCDSLKKLFKYVDCDINDIVYLFREDYDDLLHDQYIEWERDQIIAEGNYDEDNSAVEIIRELFQEDLPVYRNWNVVSDGSIEPTGAEIVTPVLNYNKAIIALENVFDFINNNQELETNASTGLHINVGTWKGEEQNKIDLLKFLLFFNDVYVAKIFNRLTFNDKNYAQTLTGKIKKFRQNNTTTLFNANLNEALISQLNDKYQTVNFNKFKDLGYLEIRAPGNVDYHKDLDKIKMVMGRISQALTIASDPNAYANEYGKKLSLLLNDEEIKNFNFETMAEFISPYRSLVDFINYYDDNIKAEELKNIAKKFKNSFSKISQTYLDGINDHLLTLPKVENNLKLKKYIELLIKIISKK
jgi:hypothetical protein